MEAATMKEQIAPHKLSDLLHKNRAHDVRDSSAHVFVLGTGRNGRQPATAGAGAAGTCSSSAGGGDAAVVCGSICSP